jgi:hypothetical protein
MATTLGTIETAVLGEIIVLSNANQATIEAYIGVGSAEVQTLFANLIKSIPSIKGALGVIGNPIEQAVEAGVNSYVAGIFAKETPAALFALYIGLLTHLQKLASG